MKTIYGLLSFGFAVFLVPLFPQLLTKAYPTGYDRHGNCVPKLSSKIINKNYSKKKGNLLQGQEEGEQTEQLMKQISDLEFMS